MALSREGQISKWLYGAFFVLILPLLLWLWEHNTAGVVRLPAVHSLPLGAGLAGAGLLLMIAGMAALWVHGGGLPMNLCPPPRFVTRSIYRFLPHPIYTGFTLTYAGWAVARGSASGLWLIAPILAMGCAALVLGYERPDLCRRFGSNRTPPLMRLSASSGTAPAGTERLSVYVLVLLPWAILYEAVSFLGIPSDARSAYLPFEAAWPVWQWTEALYASAYLFVLVVPLLARSSRDLRDFSIGGWVATALVVMLFLAVPLIAPPRPFAADTMLGRLLAWERSKDTAAAAFPSFHVIWALLAGRLCARSFPAWRWIFRAWASAIVLSCLTTGMHALVDVLGGMGVFVLVADPPRIWRKILDLSQRLANSWKEAALGPIRVLSHGVFAGIGAWAGMTLVGVLTGPAYLWPSLVIACSSLIGSAVWAQVVEGSPRLLRPFGFYGGVLGAVGAMLLLPLWGVNAWPLLGAFAVAGPWIQVLGRLRCLVNGCCHGKAAPEDQGIRYWHPQTRPCRIAGLQGTAIFPTPTYSILWNLFTGPVLFRLWVVGASLPLIAGLYLILNGLGRFVEEEYRGEPQTPMMGGLPIYQWMAVASVAAGAILTTLRTDTAPGPPGWSWFALAGAAIFGLLAWLAMGVDFPQVNRRFARLA